MLGLDRGFGNGVTVLITGCCNILKIFGCYRVVLIGFLTVLQGAGCF